MRGPLSRINVGLRMFAYVAPTFTDVHVSIIILALMLLIRIAVVGDFRAAALFLGACLLTMRILHCWNSAYLDRSGAPPYLSAFSVCILFEVVWLEIEVASLPLCRTHFIQLMFATAIVTAWTVR